ncbi:translation initiation factor IF-2 N-terminal domain-containing protein [Lactococcus ileimucosae]|uniref:translation initiation factor IF-2 N-terminal domain-containing protein n=1 Tax=Lactococcus ileimucosae TaxID=2941329 RepID=UPI003514BD76
MKIYELARELGVKSQALLFLAQKEGIEAKSVASPLTEDEMDKLLVAFDEAGGDLESLGAVPDVETAQEGRVELPQKKKGLKSPFASLKAYEKQPPAPKIPKVKTVKEGKALRIYRVLAALVIAVFIGLGYSAYKANVQVETLTKQVNATTQTLSDNQKLLSEENKKLVARVQALEEGQKKAEAASKKANPKTSTSKAKGEATKNKK